MPAKSKKAKSKSSKSKSNVWTTKDLAEYVSKQTGLSLKDSRAAIKTTFEGVAKGLKKADRVTITGMGSFGKRVKPAQRGGKKAINPFTGEQYTTKAKPKQVKVKFRPATQFKSTLGTK